MDRFNISEFLPYSFKKPRITISKLVNSNLKISFSHDGKPFFYSEEKSLL